jgi:tetratricopeptide (TPR) repeat protein
MRIAGLAAIALPCLLGVACRRPPARAPDAAPPAPLAPAAPAESSAAPVAAPRAPDPRELLAQVEALRDQIATREKSVEIMVALGNLYLENRRPLEAIDWYRQAIEAGEAGGKQGKGHAALLGRARARRANAFLLAGNEGQAIASHEENLALDPRQADSLGSLAAILASEGADPGRLRRSADLWRRYLKAFPDGEQAPRARQSLAALEARLASSAPAPAPAKAH